MSRSNVWAVAGVAAALLAGLSHPGIAQERKRLRDRNNPKASSTAERASGVIVKVEPITKGATPGSTIEREAKKGREHHRSVRLTINTAAVWRDWVRDQDAFDTSKSPKREAVEGANSIATKGEPRDQDTLVVVDLGPESKVETRFRKPDDETTKGSKTPEAARESDSDPASDSAKKGPASRRREARREAAKATRFHAADLKPGLFVEVDFRHVTAQNLASNVTVIRPVAPETAENPTAK